MGTENPKIRATWTLRVLVANGKLRHAAAKDSLG